MFPDLEYTFRHALTHEVAYGTLVRERRRAMQPSSTPPNSYIPIASPSASNGLPITLFAARHGKRP
jgi:hypothetical protein